MPVVSLSVTLFCFALVTISHESYGNVVIFRGENDRFTNMNSCHNSNAACFDNNCTECQCMVGQTFVQTRGKYGECVSDELMVYATCKWLNIWCVTIRDHTKTYTKYLNETKNALVNPSHINAALNTSKKC